MITEQELEKALELKSKIKELRIFISKLESCSISRSDVLNSKISIDSNTISVDEFTISTLKRFHNEIVNDYRHKLHAFEEEYNSIIFSPEEAFERALIDAEGEYNNGEEK